MGIFDFFSNIGKKISEGVSYVAQTVNQAIASFETKTGIDIPIVGTSLQKPPQPSTQLPQPKPIIQQTQTTATTSPPIKFDTTPQKQIQIPQSGLPQPEQQIYTSNVSTPVSVVKVEEKKIEEEPKTIEVKQSVVEDSSGTKKYEYVITIPKHVSDDGKRIQMLGEGNIILSQQAQEILKPFQQAGIEDVSGKPTEKGYELKITLQKPLEKDIELSIPTYTQAREEELKKTGEAFYKQYIEGRKDANAVRTIATAFSPYQIEYMISAIPGGETPKDVEAKALGRYVEYIRGVEKGDIKEAGKFMWNTLEGTITGILGLSIIGGYSVGAVAGKMGTVLVQSEKLTKAGSIVSNIVSKIPGSGIVVNVGKFMIAHPKTTIAVLYSTGQGISAVKTYSEMKKGGVEDARILEKISENALKSGIATVGAYYGFTKGFEKTFKPQKTEEVALHKIEEVKKKDILYGKLESEKIPKDYVEKITDITILQKTQPKYLTFTKQDIEKAYTEGKTLYKTKDVLAKEYGGYVFIFRKPTEEAVRTESDLLDMVGFERLGILQKASVKEGKVKILGYVEQKDVYRPYIFKNFERGEEIFRVKVIPGGKPRGDLIKAIREAYERGVAKEVSSTIGKQENIIIRKTNEMLKPKYEYLQPTVNDVIFVVKKDILFDKAITPPIIREEYEEKLIKEKVVEDMGMLLKQKEAGKTKTPFDEDFEKDIAIGVKQKDEENKKTTIPTPNVIDTSIPPKFVEIPKNVPIEKEKITPTQKTAPIETEILEEVLLTPKQPAHPKELPIPTPFIKDMPSGIVGGRLKMYIKYPKLHQKYKPSMVAVLFGIKGKKPDILTGLEIRPLVSRKRK